MVFATYRISDTPDRKNVLRDILGNVKKSGESRMYTLPYESQRNWAMLSLAKSMAEHPPNS